MCGIVGAVARRDVVPFLLEGLRRVEYRGYDSAGLAVMRERIERVRTVGKVAELQALVERDRPHGCTGIAHTRWATHGKPTESNAHPLVCGGEVAVVHNGSSRTTPRSGPRSSSPATGSTPRPTRR